MFTVLALTTTGLAGCLQSSTGTQQFVLGTILPQTGDLAAYGGPATQAVHMAVDEVNAAGGINGKDVKLAAGDSQTSQTAAPTEASRLINTEKIDGAVGAMSSGVTISVLNQFVQAGIPIISPASTSPTLTQMSANGTTKGWFFRTVPSDSLQGKVMAEQAKAEGFTKAAIIAVNNDYGVGFGQVFQSTFEAAGGTVTKFVKYDPQGTTFDTDVDQAASGNPQVIILIGYPDTGSTIMKAAYQKGYAGSGSSIQWLFSEGLKDPSFVTKTGQDSSGNYILAGYNGTTPQFSTSPTFTNDFTQKYGKAPALYADTAFDAAMLLMLAAQKCGCTSGSNYQTAIVSVQNGGSGAEDVSTAAAAIAALEAGKTINWVGASGDATFDSNHDVSGVYGIWHVNADGTISTVKSNIVVH